MVTGTEGKLVQMPGRNWSIAQGQTGFVGNLGQLIEIIKILITHDLMSWVDNAPCLWAQFLWLLKTRLAQLTLHRINVVRDDR